MKWIKRFFGGMPVAWDTSVWDSYARMSLIFYAASQKEVKNPKSLAHMLIANQLLDLALRYYDQLALCTRMLELAHRHGLQSLLDWQAEYARDTIRNELFYPDVGDAIRFLCMVVLKRETSTLKQAILKQANPQREKVSFLLYRLDLGVIRVRATPMRVYGIGSISDDRCSGSSHLIWVVPPEPPKANIL